MAISTTCYCVGCKKHPLHAQRMKFKKWVTGFTLGKIVWNEFKEQGAKVNCLLPESNAFYELGVEPTDFKYEITAYGDGNSVTGVDGNGYEIYAVCGNEEHEN